MEILNKTLSQMSNVFSSNEFSNKARKNGLTKREIENGVIASFLHRNAIQGETKRMWRKYDKIASEKISSEKIMLAIDLLKSAGYKILKPVSNWEEI